MTSVNCEQCGLLNRIADEVCLGCGAELRGKTAGFNPYTSEYQRPPASNAGSEAGGEGFQATVIRPFNDIGAALGPTITLFKNNLWLITKIVFVVFAPFEIFKALSIGSKEPAWQIMTSLFLLGLVAKALVAPPLIYAMMTVMRTGVAPGLNESYRWGLSRVGRLIACAMLAWVLELLGYACLIIPGIILSLAFELIYPMAVLENRSPVETLKRSYHLTDGYRLRILGVSIVLTLLCSLVSIPVGIASSAVIASGVTFWPVQAMLAMVMDIVGESTTILSLVIYLGILANTTPHEADPNGYAADSVRA